MINMNLSELFNKEEMHEPQRRLRNIYNVFGKELNKAESFKLIDEINKLKITIDEAFLVFAYTVKDMHNDVSKWVNCAIRDNKYNSILLIYISLLQKCLIRLRPYLGENLYRKETYLDESKLEEFLAAKGENFIVPFFFSTSKEVFDFGPALCTTQFYITPLLSNSRGKDIEILSSDTLGNEREVLFMKDTVFRIVDVIIERGENKIYIEEQAKGISYKYLLKYRLVSIRG